MDLILATPLAAPLAPLPPREPPLKMVVDLVRRMGREIGSRGSGDEGGGNREGGGGDEKQSEEKDNGEEREREESCHISYLTKYINDVKPIATKVDRLKGGFIGGKKIKK